MAGNPWLVDSLQTFWQLKCPECTFDSKEEDIFKYHAVTKHPLSLALFAKEFDYSVTVNNQSLDSIKTEVLQEKQFAEQGSEDRNLNFDNRIENPETVDDDENSTTSETLASTLHEELMIKEEFSELIQGSEDENLQDTNKSGRRQLKRKSNENNYQQGENLPSENKISRTTIQSENNPVSQDLGIDFYADETSSSEQSSEFNYHKKDILNLENDEAKENGWDFQIPEIGKNYSTIKSGRAIIFHHEGYNYCRSRINTDGGLVFLRFVIPQFLSFFIHNFYLYSSCVSKRETDKTQDIKS